MNGTGAVCGGCGVHQLADVCTLTSPEEARAGTSVRGGYGVVHTVAHTVASRCGSRRGAPTDAWLGSGVTHGPVATQKETCGESQLRCRSVVLARCTACRRVAALHDSWLCVNLLSQAAVSTGYNLPAHRTSLCKVLIESRMRTPFGRSCRVHTDV